MSVALVSFGLFALSQVGTPGPANMALLTTGARYGLVKALPFVGGVILGKQLIIWPIGFGLLSLAVSVPWLFEALRYLSAAYILWLAWRVAGMELKAGDVVQAPGFLAGLVVHPLNPKAWAMITVGFTSFTAPETPELEATLAIAAILFAAQLVLHPLWAYAGERLARLLAGTAQERYLMWTLAALTVASVLFVLFGGTSA